MRQVIYSKYSNERDRKFSIRTDICQDKEKRWIEKVAATPEAVPHVKNLIRWHRELAETFSGIGLAFNECEETEKGVKLAYVKAQSLEEYLDEWQTALKADMKKEGYYIRPRFSPGYGDFDIAHQDMILRMLDTAKKIGLTLTGGNMLTPSKSVTAVIGLSETETSCHIKGCEACQKKDCAYRRS